MPLEDDPRLLHNPLRFAQKVNTGELEIDDARERLPGLLKFARTFAAALLEKEFDTPLTGSPNAAREQASDLAERLEADPEASEAAVLLVLRVVDILDFEIDNEETYGDEDEDQDAYHDGILMWIGRLLDRFTDWVDPDRLPQLTDAAIETRDEFFEASIELES